VAVGESGVSVGVEVGVGVSEGGSGVDEGAKVAVGVGVEATTKLAVGRDGLASEMVELKILIFPPRTSVSRATARPARAGQKGLRK